MGDNPKKPQSRPWDKEQKWPRYIQELRTQYLRVKSTTAALRMWERMLTEKDRQRVGGDLEKAYWLDLPPQDIRIFLVDEDGKPTEWTG